MISQGFPEDDIELKTSTVGFPMEHQVSLRRETLVSLALQEVKVVDGEGRTVPVGEVGELCTRYGKLGPSAQSPSYLYQHTYTRGYSTMLGYWNDSERTAEVVGRDGWLHTGDLATITQEGYGRWGETVGGGGRGLLKVHYSGWAV